MTASSTAEQPDREPDGPGAAHRVHGNDEIRWTVGVDLTGRSHGALAVARWLHERTHALGHRFRGVHVIERRLLARARYPGIGDPHERARALTRASIKGMRAQGAVTDVRVVEARNAARGLEAGVQSDGGGLIIGRAGPTSGWSLVSLGPIARRLLLRLPAPVCVVPPDLDPEILDPGPLLVALSTEPTCLPALRFATQLSRQLRRPLVGVHGVAALEVGVGAPETEAAAYLHSARGRGQRHRARIEQYCAAAGVPVPSLRLMHLAPTDAVMQTARRNGACAIVCGGHRRSFVDRMVRPSVSRALAARSARPVFVIPELEDDAP